LKEFIKKLKIEKKDFDRLIYVLKNNLTETIIEPPSHSPKMVSLEKDILTFYHFDPIS
jgi:hypothetical protein